MKFVAALFTFFFFFGVKETTGFTGEVTKTDEACSITSFATIFRLTPSQYFNSREVIKNSTCNEFVNNKFSSLLSTTEGVALSNHLVKELQNEFPNLNIEILPAKISLQNFNDLLKERLTAESNLFFIDTKLMTSKKLIVLNEGERLEISCDNCLSYGDRSIKVDIVDIMEGTRVTSWASSKVAAKVTILKANRNIGVQNEKFKKEDFVLESMLTTEPNKFISNYDDIKFFKPNKTLIKGMPITTTDISPIQLVKYGTPVKIILKNQNISILRNAIPHRSASFGETIELKNPQNNKLITGKVIDFNKVLIEL